MTESQVNLLLNLACVLMVWRVIVVVERIKKRVAGLAEFYDLTRGNAQLTAANAASASETLCKINQKADALPSVAPLVDAVATVPSKTAEAVVQAIHSDSGVIKQGATT